MALGGALYVELTDIDEEGSFDCNFEGNVAVYGVAGPYQNDDGLWTCGVFVYDEGDYEVGDMF